LGNILEICGIQKKVDMNTEAKKVLEKGYSSSWITLSGKEEIFIAPEFRFQEGHYGFKPKGIWLAKGTGWIDFIEEEGIDFKHYCSAFKVDLGEDILVLNDLEDYNGFTLRYAISESKIDWVKVAKRYNGIALINPRRFQFNEGLQWVYGWDITSACIWSEEGVESIEMVYDGCNNVYFKKGGNINDLQKEMINKYPQLKTLFLFEDNDTISLDMIEVELNERKKGIGSEIMQEIVDYADRNGKEVVLVPAVKDDLHKTTSRSRLVKFYKRFGFVENKGRNKDFTKKGGSMYRLPKFKKGGSVTTWKHKYNKKYGYPKDKSHSLKEISKDTGISMKGIQEIYNKGIGAYKTNPASVRPNVKSKEQWAYARVYSAVMGGKASKVDAKELKMEIGGLIKGSELIKKVSNYGSREGTDMIEFANENINPESNYVLKEIKVSELINNDIDLASFVDEVIDNPTMYSDVTEFENPNTHKMPIVINDKGLVADGYGRVANSVYNDFDKVFAYVPNDLNKYEFGGQVCTYDFEGYEVYKRKCGENVAQYLIPAEYDRVSIWLFENEFPLWMYYNYLARITASAENILTFKTQFQKEFDLEDYNVDLNIEPESNNKFWKNQPYGKARSFMSYSEDGSGKIRSLGITLVAGGEWTKRFKERTSGLNIPHPVNGVLLNTAIHEFAHLLDVIRYNQKNPNEKIIVTHQRGFLIALRDILIKCRNNEIAIVGILDNKAYLTQKLLQDEGYQEMFRKQYGIKKETRPDVLKVSFNISIPKELKEYDSRLDIKGKVLEDMDIQQVRTLIDEYKKTDLREIAEFDFKKADRLHRAINKITLELKRIEKNIAFDEIKGMI
jgi:GNAT superfamily N-acetyltransferase